MFTAEKLAQTNLSDTATAIVTSPSGKKTQISSIFLVNTGSVDRVVSIFAHGTADTNKILDGIVVAANGSTPIGDCKVILPSTEVLAAKQNTGTDIVMTVYGLQEA